MMKEKRELREHYCFYFKQLYSPPDLFSYPLAICIYDIFVKHTVKTLDN